MAGAPPELVPEPAWTSDRAPVAVRDEPRTAVVARFEDHARARAAGTEVWRVLRAAAAGPERVSTPMPPPSAAERAWFDALGIDQLGRGIGWVGAEAASGPAVRVLGPVVVVGDLAFVPYDAAPEVPDNPLLAALSARGALAVMDEHGWEDDFGIGFDLACSAPTSARAQELAAEVEDLLALPHEMTLLPPWAGGISAEQRRLRREYRRATAELASAAGGVLDTEEGAQLLENYSNALIAGSDRDAERASRALSELLSAAQRRVDLAAFSPLIQRWLAEDIAERLAPRPRDDEEERKRQRRRERARALERGALLGQAPYELVGDGRALAVPAIRQLQVHLGYIETAARAVHLGSFLPADRFDTTFLAMSDWLEGQGCGDLRFVVIDADDPWNL